MERGSRNGATDSPLDEPIDGPLVEEQGMFGVATERGLRWLPDGASTLSEVIFEIESFLEYLAELKVKGWELVAPVDNLYMHLQNPAHPIGNPEVEG